MVSGTEIVLNGKSEEFLAWLYNDSNAPKDVVVNDRWGGETRFKNGGYFSTEYDPNSDLINEEFLKRGWEECRGIGKSFDITEMKQWTIIVLQVN